MGVSAEVHRARIGTYASSRVSVRTWRGQPKCFSSHFFQLPVSLVLILILLFIGGIELNPGPTYQCQECSAVLISAQQYFNHQKEEHCTIRCCFRQCFGRFVTLSAFQSHLSRSHVSQDKAVPSFQCPVLNCSLSKVGQTLKVHLETHIDAGHEFICPYGDSCKTLHKNKNSFRVHLSRKHSSQQSTCSSHSTTQNLPSTSRTSVSEVSSATIVPQDSSLAVSNPLAPNIIKKNVLTFYLELEGQKVLPSVTVQFISEKIASFTVMSHHCMRQTLEKELVSAGLEKRKIAIILDNTFSADPVHGIHHFGHDQEQVSSVHLRREQMKRIAPYIPSVEIPLPTPNMEKMARVAQYVPLKETLEVLLADNNVKREVLKSFSRQSIPDVYEDFCDGSIFKKHLEQHANHKCIQIIMFQDAFEYSPFGPAKGLYKTAGWYFVVGNLSAEYRSKLDMTMLILLIQEHYLKPSVQELLHNVDKYQEALAPLIKDFQELKNPGIEIDGIAYPVCLIIMTGDNLGQHQVGGYVQSFSGDYCCRYCAISKEEFLKAPHICAKFRSAEDYDECVKEARKKFIQFKNKALQAQARKREKALKDSAAGLEVEVPTEIISKSALQKLKSIHHLGIKPCPSALNNIPGFHVNLSMAPCIAHDLFQGLVSNILAKILENLAGKNWFDLPTLNRRIVSFKCKGQDALDAPAAIKSFEGIKGHAVETWTLLRLLPLMIHDLVKDPEDEHWLLYLKLKQLCEYVCAPKINLSQITYLSTLIQEFLCSVLELLPSCLTAKCQYLAHYPQLIKVFGPLIRLFTLRFESRHVFFKHVAKQCKTFVNITKTLASKYQYKFAYDHINGFLPDELKYTQEELVLAPTELPPIPAGTKVKMVKEATFKGTKYETGMYMLISKLNLIDLSVGCIKKIFVYPGDEVYFLLTIHEAASSGNGYYIINQKPSSTKGVKLLDLPDYYPLSSYTISGNNHQPTECISLKHTALFM